MNLQQQQHVSSLWGNGVKPSVFFSDSPPNMSSTVLFTVNDDKSVFKFITEEKRIYMVARSKAVVVPATDTTAAYYKIQNDAFHYVSCPPSKYTKYADDETMAYNIMMHIKSIPFNLVDQSNR